MHGRVDASVHEGFSLHHACGLTRRAAVLGSNFFFFFLKYYGIFPVAVGHEAGEVSK